MRGQSPLNFTRFHATNMSNFPLGAVRVTSISHFPKKHQAAVISAKWIFNAFAVVKRFLFETQIVQAVQYEH